MEDLLKDNAEFPPDPGPFKTAALFLVSSLYFVEFKFYPLNKNADPLNEYHERLWKTRFIYKAITVFLEQLKLTKTNKQLAKQWDVPSIHYRLDFLNFMRRFKIPLSSEPLPPVKAAVDTERVTRLVMSFTLIIESCYYLTGNELVCDVKDCVHIDAADFEVPLRPDLDFDVEV